MSEIPRIVCRETLEDVDFSLVHQALNKEIGFLLPRTEYDLQTAYQEGRAQVAVIGHIAVSFIELSPLLDQERKRQLVLPCTFPMIWEIGGAITIEDYRGRGIYPELRKSLLQKYLPQIHKDELLILGTTKNVRVLDALGDASKIGIDFLAAQHEEFPMVAAFTCVCTGEFGCGFQYSEDCFARASTDLIPLAQNMDRLEVKDNGRIDCVMYVSSEPLARRMNRELIDRFASPIPSEGQNRIRQARRNLVTLLKEFNYYGTL